MVKRNWGKLKQKYIRGSYVDLKDFSDKEKIPYNTLRRHTRTWRKVRTEIEEKGEQKTVEAASDAIAEMNVRHIEKAKLLQEHASGRLKHLDYETASGAAMALKAGIEIEREVLLPKGIDTEVHLIIKGKLPISKAMQSAIDEAKKSKT